ncbi:MAG: LysM peptidoglycan-binding domain-containing protein [Brevibacillus sp.]|nr:LysM peptidoglycan-binding domain-containing protein [Brevibacillus sp.]
MNTVHSRSAMDKRKGKTGITRGQALLILFASLVFFYLLTGLVFADAEQPDQMTYKVVTVQPGDSLWKLAAKYRDEAGMSLYELIDEIKYRNNLSGALIYPGQNLMIPVQQ